MSASPVIERPALLACGLSHPGLKRTDNEDSIGTFVDDRLFIVADGVGGHSAGEIASATAVESLGAFFRSYHANPHQKWPHPVDRSLSLGGNLLSVGIKVANDKIRAEAAADRSRSRMASTIVAMAVGDAQLTIAHSGDSRAYRIRGGEITRLTRDHSILEEMMAARPDMSEEELSSFSHRNVVTKCLGSKDEIDPTVSVEPLYTGDTYLLCSDGLWGPVRDVMIGEIVNAAGADLAAASQALIDAANTAGGPDNISVILVRVVRVA
jgi:protein phosphatase